MQENKDVRWKQRFENFEKAFFRLKEAIELIEPSELKRNGIVQRFEFTIEVAWKTLKDFLEEKEFNFKPSPKETIRLAQQSGYINYAQELMDGLELRNELSHDYSGQKFLQLEYQLRTSIYPVIEKLYFFLKSEL
ncbi:MAG: HI0074 family nucleotidyltransferase substrate-binding subunit [Saprospiraceae bacterium]